MNRPPLRDLFILACVLGVGSGAAEVAIRAEPRLGMSTGEVLTWSAVSVGLGVIYLLIAAAVAWAIGWRARGWLLSAAIVVHAALYYRFELFLNEFLYDPKVWGGLLIISVVSLVIGLLCDAGLKRLTRPIRVGSAAIGLLSIAVAGIRAVPPSGAAQERPNVVVITMDTTRPDQLSPYGSDNPTPALDRIASAGVVFEQAISTAPLTEPSHLAILTGIPPYISGIVSNGTAMGDRPALLSRVLQAEGYTTAGFVSGFPLHGKYGWTQGFDVYDDDFGSLRGLHRLSIMKLIDQIVLPAHTLRERRGDSAVSRAQSWVEAHHDEAFFLWVHLFDPHAPYESPDHDFSPPTDGEPLTLPQYWPPPHRAITSTEWLTEAYRAEIRYTDALIGELLDTLDAQGLTDNTIVVLTADHGESLTEHDYLFDHGDFLYDASLKVPLIVAAPGNTAGHRIGCQVSSLDVTPTVLGLLGISDGIERFGVDRGRELSGGDCDEEAVISTTIGGRFMENPPVDNSLRARGHKLIEKGQGGTECYNILSDPNEAAELGGACISGLSESLSTALQEGGPAASPEMNQETQNMLESLGYIE
ncbi:MAG: sulfatase [Myxococcota bacterium]|nr:sulfatase [Myxococcota bacterium]